MLAFARRAGAAFGDLSAYSWDSVLPPDPGGSFAQFKLQQKYMSFPRLQRSGITVLLFQKHVAFVSKHSHTRTRALHTANKYPAAFTEL